MVGLMKAAAESLTLRIPRAVVAALPTLSEGLLTRMHDLLERNAEGQLSVHERAEVESLVKMAEFAQLLSLAAAQTDAP